MNEIQALHAAARRYCVERFDYWAERYKQLLPRMPVLAYTPKQLDTFPRYNMVDAIREAIESAVSGDFSSLHDLRVFLISTARNVETQRTQGSEDIARQAMHEERDLFCNYVEGVTDGQLRRIEPLPYRRSLSETETIDLRTRVHAKWDWDGKYWYPLIAEDMPQNVIALQYRYFHDEVGAEALQRLLHAHQPGHLYEFREWRPDLEIDDELLDALYTQERFWTNDEMDWVVYVSHESSITFAGQWLIEAILEIWPNWRQRIYVDWDYA